MSENLPLVTVVTATFNLVSNGRVDVFRQCVESVHAQDYPHIEHLIIDGASTDGTLDIIREYQEKGWVTCHSEPDKGIYDAMNKGISRAAGKYIAFLNSDDLWHDPKGVSQTVKILELTQGDISCAPVKIAREDGQFSHYWGAMPAIFFSRITFNHQTALTRTELMRDLGGFDAERYRIVADYDFITRALLRGAKPVYVPYCFTTFKLGGISSDIDKFETEMHEVHRHNFATFVGEEATREMYGGKMPVYLYRLLLALVHPIVAEELKQIVETAGGYAVLKRNISHSYKCPEEVLFKDSLIPQQTEKNDYIHKIRILWLIPLCYKKQQEKAAFFFCGIPLMTFREQRAPLQKHVISAKLLGLIPLYSLEQRNDGNTKIFSLFGIPVLKMKASGY